MFQSLAPSVARRLVLVTGCGPFDRGSKPGSEGCRHTPEKSGTDVVGVCATTGAIATARVTSTATLKFPTVMITPKMYLIAPG